MKSVYCIIELFTPYNEYGDRQSLGFIGKRSDGIFCYDYNKYGAHKFTEDEASSYVKQLIPHYTVKVYHYNVKPSKSTKPAIEHINEPFIELYLGDRDFVIGLIKHYGTWDRF